MHKPHTSVDITGNYKTIETLKASILKNVADMYESMMPGGKDAEYIGELMAELIIDTYILSDKMGIEYGKLDDIIKNKLKLMSLQSEDNIHYKISELYKQMQ